MFFKNTYDTFRKYFSEFFCSKKLDYKKSKALYSFTFTNFAFSFFIHIS